MVVDTDITKVKKNVDNAQNIALGAWTTVIARAVAADITDRHVKVYALRIARIKNVIKFADTAPQVVLKGIS